MKALLLVLVAVATQAQPPQTRRIREPKTYFVSLSGVDTNEGTQEKPFRTIQHGADLLLPTDTLNIAGGVYKERVILTRSGSYFDRDIHIQALPGEEVILDAEGLPAGKGIFDTGGHDHLDIKGITVRNGGMVGFEIQGSWRIKLTNCRAQNITASGIHIDKSQQVVIDGCEVTQACKTGEESVSIKRSADVVMQNCHVHDTGHEGIDVKEGSRHVKILNNHVHHVERQGLYADAWDSDTYDIRFEGNVVHDSMMGMAACTESGGLLYDVWFVNNVIYNCKGPGMILAKWGNAGMTHRIRDVVFANNTVVNCGNGSRDGKWGGGMLLENDQAENVWVLNNVLSGSPQDQLRLNHLKLAPKNLTISNNLLDGPTEKHGKGNLIETAQFVNAAAHDYHLVAGSPGIDRGTKHAWSGPLDASGQPRVQGRSIDIGAFESPR